MSGTSEWSGLENSLGAQIKRTQQAMGRALARHLAVHGIPVGMWYFLRVLWEEDGLSQREVGRRVGATPAATTEQLRNMEERGLIARVGHATDARQKDVSLTAEGRALKDTLLDYPRRIEAHALAGLSVGEAAFLRLCLAQIRRNLADYEATPGAGA